MMEPFSRFNSASITHSDECDRRSKGGYARGYSAIEILHENRPGCTSGNYMGGICAIVRVSRDCAEQPSEPKREERKGQSAHVRSTLAALTARVMRQIPPM